MMKEVECRPARARALFEMPDTDSTEYALQCVALEPIIQQLRYGHRKHAGKIDDRLLAKSPNVETEAGDAGELAWIARLDVRWRHDVETLQDGRQPAHARAEVGPFGGIGGGGGPNPPHQADEGPRQAQSAPAPPRRRGPGGRRRGRPTPSLATHG